MRGKLKDGSRRLAGFIYAPLGLYSPASLLAVGERFASLLAEHCGATNAPESWAWPSHGRVPPDLTLLAFMAAGGRAR